MYIKIPIKHSFTKFLFILNFLKTVIKNSMIHYHSQCQMVIEIHQNMYRIIHLQQVVNDYDIIFH